MASYQLLQKAGYDVVPFSLTYPDKAVRYNPLQMVIENIRRGRIPAASTDLSNLSSTFFPSANENDFWISTARSVFQMMTYQLMNYMVEEEKRSIRLYQSHMSGRKLEDTIESLGYKVRPVMRSQSALDDYVDELWGKVSMNSMYQMIAQLDVMKLPDGLVAAADTKYSWDSSDAENFEMPEEVSGLDVLASAIRELPDNAIRRNFKGPDTMLRKATSSDATTGSIYATALTNMSFFVQETIKKLTTVSPRNGLNILDFPFPRRFSVKLDPLVMRRLHLGRRRFRATLYQDPFFKKPYGDIKHETVDDGAIESSGWINFWFKKIPKRSQFYIQIDILDADETNVVISLKFAIDKGFLLSEDGSHYILDPITKKPIIKDGTAYEVQPMTKAEAIALRDAGKRIRMSQKRNTAISTRRVRNDQRELIDESIISQIMFNYTEKPKALFLSIPPQIEEQAKLALVLIDSVFNTSMGKGYEFRGDIQKPDYGTRYMLEELGNLKSDGTGIPAMDSKLSIGLSANQQMTMVFQGMKQVSSVYGDNMYDIVKDNVGIVHYMLSTSDDTLTYISDLTGKTHFIDISSQNISEAVGSMDNTDNTISTQKSKSEIPVISKEKLARLTDGETVVITPTRRRDKMNRVTRTNPVFNTGQQLLPFAYAVLSAQTKATEASGHGTAETASTIYSTVDAHPDQMVPDFSHVLRVTLRQAMYYVRHREALKEKFINDTTPFGSETLSDVIMDHITYEVDVNQQLLADGLGPYMMLTKTEIVNAFNSKQYEMDRTLASNLLSKLGFNPDEILGAPIVDSDAEVDAVLYPGSSQDTDLIPVSYLASAVDLSSEEFDYIMTDLVESANKGDYQAKDLLSRFLDKLSWSNLSGAIKFANLPKSIQMIDSDGVAFLKGNLEMTRFFYQSSDSFKEMFEGDRGDDVFVEDETYEAMCEIFAERK